MPKTSLAWPWQLVPVMESVEGVKNAWAPETKYDPSTNRVMIYWSSAGDDYHNRIWRRGGCAAASARPLRCCSFHPYLLTRHRVREAQGPPSESPAPPDFPRSHSFHKSHVRLGPGTYPSSLCPCRSWADYSMSNVSAPAILFDPGYTVIDADIITFAHRCLPA